jgi:hypothetical protein
VFEPRALNELLPDWRARGAPLETEAIDDRFLFLTERRALRLPTPPQMHNRGNYIISLANLCRWLAKEAEALGVEIYPGFAGAEVLYDELGKVRGVATGPQGIGKDGEPTAQCQPGVELVAKETLFAEGCRGSLTKTLEENFGLRRDSGPQTYGIGIKELWEIDAAQHHPGRVVHSVGWPLDAATYGGSFLYHLENRQVAVGFVIGLDYDNPFLNPLWRPGAERRRVSIDSAPQLSRWARHRLRGWVSQRAQDQGQPHRDEIGDGGGGNDLPAPARRCRRRLRRSARRVLDLARAFCRAQHPAGVPPRFMGRPRLRRARYVCLARQGAVDLCAERRLSPSETRRSGAADRVSQARRRRQLRSPVLGLHLQYQSRGKPAAAFEAPRSGKGDHGQLCRL